MLNLNYITAACDSPDELATFWEEALDGERAELPAGAEEAMVDPGEAGVAMLFKPMETEST